MEMTKFDYSKIISKKRSAGKLDEAVHITLQAADEYPDENLFEKILGDLYFQKENFELAGEAYIRFLIKLGNDVQYMKHFANFFQRYVRILGDNAAAGYAHKVEMELDRNITGQTVIFHVCEILARYTECPEIALFQDDCNFQKAVAHIHKVENSYLLYNLYQHILLLEHSEQNKRIDKYVVSTMEKRKHYQQALHLIKEVLKYDTDQVAIRTLFRLCRKSEDYFQAEKYISEHPEVEKAENFNVLYELVFYYSNKGDLEKRSRALGKIEKCGKRSIPIMRTLYNFYLQFGMLDKAAETASKITVMENSARKERGYRKEQEEDAQAALLHVLREWFDELEHSRKLISMSEILKGFSHELGQPVTNIRYSIQLYQMKMEMGIHTELELRELFNDILSQTSRIKGLLSRFAPIVSEKKEQTRFHVAEEIKHVFLEFDARLCREDIGWKVFADRDFTLYGDTVKFDQVFYNLIGNAIYAIKEKGVKGKIFVHILEREDAHIILFEDNGTGIAPQYLDKVFEPFFTTKEHQADENTEGEGLGLYIIWNIIHMFDGNIKVDKSFRQGARFIIEIAKKENRKEKNE